MADELRTQVEQVKQQADVKQALKQTTRTESTKPAAETKDKLWLGTALLLLVGLAVLHYILLLPLFSFLGSHISILSRATIGAMAIVSVFLLAKIVDVYLVGPIENPVSRYNLRRVLKLLTGIVVLFLVISILFQNWYTTLVSVGLISLSLGLALQTPITSFIGWIYIMVKAPYRVGDRIKIEDSTGDVIDVGYIDTTLWEFGGGDLLSTDHPTGRIIKFPNSRVLSNAVYNYTWPLFPYIWNEIKFSVAYDSDLEFIAKTMERVAAEEVGERMMKQVRVFREILAQTPVDQLEVREHPAVLFRVNSNTWLDAIVRYLVHPKEAGRVKTRLIKKLLTELNAAPDRVLFPKSNAR
jgi:small-conductance mechanosensitive channel